MSSKVQTIAYEETISSNAFFCLELLQYVPSAPACNNVLLHIIVQILREEDLSGFKCLLRRAYFVGAG